MKITRETLLIGFIGIALMYFPGCGGSTASTPSSPSTPTTPAAVAVAISSPPASVTAGQTAQLTATVANDSANAGVTWSCTPANSCGSFSPTKTASGATTTYTAPGTAGSVTIVATSVTDGTKAATATITVAAAQQGAISIKVTGPTTLAVNATGTFTAAVINDSAGKGVNWSCTPTGTCGSFNPASGTGNSVTTTYTAPGTAGTVQIVATSQADGKTTGTASVTVGSGSSTLSLQAGTYVFTVLGEDSAKRTLGIVGAVVLDGKGNVTGGEQDYDNADGVAGDNTAEQGTPDMFQAGGTYTVSQTDGRGNLIVSVANTKEGVSGKETFSIAAVNSKHALITEFDGNATSSGSLDFQTPPPNSQPAYTVVNLAGAYSFAVTGFNEHFPYSQGGVFTLNATGDVANGVTDFNELNGSVTINTNLVKPNPAPNPPIVQYPTAFAPGCAQVNGGTALNGCGQAPDQFGRGTADFGGIFWSYYVVGPEVMRIIGYYGSIDGNGGANAIDDVYVGSAYGQGSAKGSFTTASLNGSYVFNDLSVFPDSSRNSAGNADLYFAAAGMLTAQQGASVSGFIDATEASTTSFAPASNGGKSLSGATFSVTSPTQGTGGSGILTLPSANTAGLTTVGVYFVDPNLNILDPNNTTTGLGGALVVNLDPTNVGSGVLIPQGTISGALSGNFAFGNQAFNAKGEQDAVGQVVIGSGNSITGKMDVNDLFGSNQSSGASLTGTLTPDNTNTGRFTATITTTLNGTATTFTLVLYEINPSGYLEVETDTNQVGTGSLQSQQ